MLQANCDIQLLIDPHACLEDFTKYAAKAKRCHQLHVTFPVMQVYMKVRYGTISHKGYVVPLPYNVHKVVDIFLRVLSDIPVLVFHAPGIDDRTINF